MTYASSEASEQQDDEYVCPAAWAHASSSKMWVAKLSGDTFISKRLIIFSSAKGECSRCLASESQSSQLLSKAMWVISSCVIEYIALALIKPGSLGRKAFR